MDKTIKYTSPNGYTGIMYGLSSMAIFDKDGKEAMHTGFRSMNTKEELKEFVDKFPEFLAMLHDLAEKDIDDDAAEI